MVLVLIIGTEALGVHNDHGNIVFCFDNSLPQPETLSAGIDGR